MNSEDETVRGLKYTKEEIFQQDAEECFSGIPDDGMSTYTVASEINLCMSRKGYSGVSTASVCSQSKHRKFTVKSGNYNAEMQDEGYTNPAFNSP